MRKLYSLLSITLIVLFVASSCSDEEGLIKPPKPKEETISPISQFVYDGLSAYYLWSDEMINKKPTVKDTDPKKYFESVLYKTDTDNDWSWITDDAKGLVGEFAGTQKSFGYSLSFRQIDNTIYALVEYAYANTPVSDADLQRLDLIGEVNGQPITTEKGTNYISQRDIDILYGNNPATFSIYRLINKKIVFHKKIEVAPAEVKTDPVLFDKVYPFGDKKIGYLFYTNFISNYNDRLFEVFNKFKNEGVTDLILDLRYNPGGGLDAASYLVSLFAPKSLVEEKTVLTTLTFNKFVNEYYSSKKWSRDTKLGAYQEKDVFDKEDGRLKYKAAPNPIGANIDINKVYIIATENSASASELTIFCSRPIMGESNVIHIGGETSGKYTASFTVHPFDDEIGNTTYDEKDLSEKEINTLKNWAMQPIVAVYKDKNGKDFIDPGYLEPKIPLKEGFGDINYWVPIGDTKDVFLGQALFMITGDESYKPVEPKSTLPRSSQREEIELLTKNDNAKPVLIENIKISSEDFKEIRRMRNSKE